MELYKNIRDYVFGECGVNIRELKEYGYEEPTGNISNSEIILAQYR